MVKKDSNIGDSIATLFFIVGIVMIIMSFKDIHVISYAPAKLRVSQEVSEEKGGVMLP